MRIVGRVLQDDRIWIVIAYFGLAAVIVVLYFHQTEIGKQEATRTAERQASVTQCIRSIPQLTKVQRFIEGVQVFHKAAAMNALATLQATPKTDPQYGVRLENYRRIEATVAAVSGVRFRIPTRAECERLGAQP